MKINTTGNLQNANDDCDEKKASTITPYEKQQEKWKSQKNN